MPDDDEQLQRALVHAAGALSNGFAMGHIDEYLISKHPGRFPPAEDVLFVFGQCGELAPTPDWALDRAIDDAVEVEADPDRPFPNPHGYISADAGVTRPVFDVVVAVWNADGPTGLGLSMRLLPLNDVPGMPPGPMYQGQLLGFVKWGADQVGPPPATLPPKRPPFAEREPIELVPTDLPVPEAWREPLFEIVRRLLAKDHDGLLADGHVLGDERRRLQEAQRRIDAYPLDVFPPPAEVWIEAEAWLNPTTGDWDVNVPLWDQTGPADMSLELIVAVDGDSFSIRIEKILN